MSMNPESESFQDLRRLLTLKRHEQPPPGYFVHFSAQVIGRIEAGRLRDESEFFELVLGRIPWLKRAWTTLETKPIYAGAFGMAVCGILVSGVIYSANVGSNEGGITGIQRIGQPAVPIEFVSGSEQGLRQAPLERATPNGGTLLVDPAAGPSLFGSEPLGLYRLRGGMSEPATATSFK